MSAGCTLLPRRTTVVNYGSEDGVLAESETIEDEWDGDSAHRVLDQWWTGYTVFYTDDAKERAGTPSQLDVCYAFRDTFGVAPVGRTKLRRPDWAEQTLAAVRGQEREEQRQQAEGVLRQHQQKRAERAATRGTG